MWFDNMESISPLMDSFHEDLSVELNVSSKVRGSLCSMIGQKIWTKRFFYPCSFTTSSFILNIFIFFLFLILTIFTNSLKFSFWQTWSLFGLTRKYVFKERCIFYSIIVFLCMYEILDSWIDMYYYYVHGRWKYNQVFFE